MAIRGSKGDTTNRSVPITNIVSQPIANLIIRLSPLRSFHREPPLALRQVRTTDRPLWPRSSDLGPGFFDLPARGSTGGAVISVSQDSLRNLIAVLRISGDLTPANAMPFRPGSTTCGIPRPKAHTAHKLFP